MRRGQTRKTQTTQTARKIQKTQTMRKTQKTQKTQKIQRQRLRRTQRQRQQRKRGGRATVREIEGIPVTANAVVTNSKGVTRSIDDMPRWEDDTADLFGDDV
jgi:hypothetical protein